MRTRPVYVSFFFTLLFTCLRLWLQWMTNRHSDETFKLKQSNMYIDSYDYGVKQRQILETIPRPTSQTEN